MKCPNCQGKHHIERWPCPLYETRQYHPYNDDQLYHRDCGYREMVRKGTTPDNWVISISERTLHRLVLSQECKECDADPHGKRCIHYYGCRNEVRDSYLKEHKPVEKAPEVKPTNRVSRFEYIID